MEPAAPPPLPEMECLIRVATARARRAITQIESGRGGAWESGGGRRRAGGFEAGPVHRGPPPSAACCLSALFTQQGKQTFVRIECAALPGLLFDPWLRDG